MTTPATMAVAKRVFEAANAQLAAGLSAAGLAAGALPGGVFMAEVHDKALGLVGEIKSVRLEKVDEVLAGGRIPVLSSLGLNGAGASLNINADVAARELAIALKPVKVVFISAGGGWKEGAYCRLLCRAPAYSRSQHVFTRTHMHVQRARW